VVVTLGGGAEEVGLLNAARWLPYLVVGLVVGALVDRMRRRPVMVAADLTRAALLAVIPLLWMLDRLSLVSVALVVLGVGTASVVHGAAEMSLLPRLIDRADLQRAHARIDGTDAAAMTAGPALGGALVQALGAPVAVLVDAITFLVSAVLVSLVAVEERARRSPSGARQLLREVRDGVRWLYRGVELRVMALSGHWWFAAHAVVGVVAAPFVLRTLGLSAGAFGLVGAAGGVGALLGAAVTTRVGLRLGTGRTIVVCHGISALGTAVMLTAVIPATGSAGALALMAAGQTAYGAAMGMSNSHEMSFRQLVTPDELQARVNTTGRAVNRTVIVVVSPLAGLFAGAFGNPAGLGVATGLFAVLTAGLAMTPFVSVRAPE
jgi:Na+/melibiose symporter-like transporter